jgi:hypothetical protein
MADFMTENITFLLVCSKVFIPRDLVLWDVEEKKIFYLVGLLSSSATHQVEAHICKQEFTTHF